MHILLNASYFKDHSDVIECVLANDNRGIKNEPNVSKRRERERE